MSTSSAPPQVAAWRPTLRDLVLMAVVVVAIAASGPIVAVSTAPVLAMAFWRCSLAAVATSPLAIRESRGVALSSKALRNSLISGVCLAAHFGLWIPSLRMTTVAASVALSATQPLWSTLVARYEGEYIAKQVWFGLAFAFAGVITVVGVDFGVSPRALTGDLMSLAGAIAVTGYMTIGSKVRQQLPTATYTTLAYASSGAVLVAVMLLLKVPVSGYTREDWTYILILTIGPQLLGHSILNTLVKTTAPTVLGLAILLEIPGSAIVASVWLGQTLHFTVAVGIALILAGLVVVVTARDKRELIEAG